MKKNFTLVLLLFLCGAAYAQSPLDERVSINVKEVLLEDALYELVDKSEVKLTFSNETIPPVRVTLRLRRQKVKTVLAYLLAGTTIQYKTIGKQIVLYQPESAPTEKKFTISGFLEDAATGELLIGANVYDQLSGKGMVTNEYGFYSLTLPAGTVALHFSYLGYQSQYRNLQLSGNKQLNISLIGSLTLQEIVVVARDSAIEIKKEGISADYLDTREVERIPKLAGESDIVRAIQLLPGVQTGTDGIEGLHIRGGNTGQNLILIDGVPVYDISHAAGLFSIFNTSAIRSAKLVKGGFPARYGGRISSVLDIRTKEGNKKAFKARADLGMLSAKLALEGPIVPEKSSFFISGRWSFLNWYIRPISEAVKQNNGDTGFTDYRFYDFNAKFNYEISDRDKLYISLYYGGDQFKNSGESIDTLVFLNPNQEIQAYRLDQEYREQLDWGNRVAAFRWNHLVSNKLFANTALTYSKLQVTSEYLEADSITHLNTGNYIAPFSFGRYQSSIEDIGLQVDFDFIPSASHYFRFGLSINKRNFNPGVRQYDNTLENPLARGILTNPISATENAFYVEDEFHIGEDLSINAGMRASFMSVRNANYRSFQPRLLAYWQAAPFLGFKASLSRMNQFVHRLSRSNIGLPTDIWVPSTNYIKPQDSWQYVVGTDIDFLPGATLGIEGYYKEMNNLLNFSEGARFLDDWEENLTSGSGRSYGMEVLLKKQRGRTSGWIAYTLSWTDRVFGNINFGQRYPFRYDRRHDLKIVLIHKFNPKLELTANWVFSSGFAFSLPLEKFDVVIEDPPRQVEVLDTGAKNQYRMPYYHRLDVGLNYYVEKPRVAHVFNFGIYNTYNRKNPLYYKLRTDYVNEDFTLKEIKQFVQVWLLPVLPSFNYTIKF